MINLSKRSAEKELLDRENIPFEDITQNMKELNQVNTLLGGHAITISGVNELVNNNEPLIICEIGCGGGDNLSAIDKWCRVNNIQATFSGIDIKEECITYARQQYPHLNSSWVKSDYAQVTFPEKPTIIFSSLFCHHFTDDDLVKMLKWMQHNSRSGFFINDLHRHPIAYYSIKWLSRMFSKSYLLKNDAPLSVARSFKKKEWRILLNKAGIDQYKIRWKWAFRFLIICKH